MISGQELREIAYEYKDYVVERRREFHRYPELSGEEHHTRQILIRELEDMKVPYRLLEGTGIIGIIEGTRPGKARALRADMDGLPVKEDTQNLRQEKACVSGIEGVCHACGHDAHMAVLLGTMRALMKLRERLEGTVYCCFEEGEETNCGVETMLKALAQYPVEECFALHVYSGLDAGKVNVVPGPRMAGTVGIGFLVKGKAGHGSRPDQAANPIVPAAHIVTQIDSAFLNQLDAEETVTLSLCMFQSGDAPNVIPEQAYIAGTARFFNKEEGARALNIVNTVAEHTALCHKCKVEFLPRNQVSLQPVINDRQVALEVSREIGEICGQEVLADCDRWYASECYSRYLELYPGALGLLGIRNESYGSGAAHHNGKFDIDESSLPLGICAELAFVFK